jgi:Zn-dependent protease with chaperone function
MLANDTTLRVPAVDPNAPGPVDANATDQTVQSKALEPNVISAPDLRGGAFAPREISPENAISNIERAAEPPATTSGEVNRRYNLSIAALNTAIAGAGVATVAAHGLAVGIILPNVIMTAPSWLLTYGATTIGLGLLSRIGAVEMIVRRAVQRAGKTEQNAESHERVTQSLDRLSAKLGKPLDFHVSVRKGERGLAFLVDRLVKRDLLALDSALVSKLSDAELDGLIAHEVSHSNRTFSKFQQARVMLHCFSSPAIFWGTALPVYSALALGYGGLLAGGAAIATATSAWVSAVVSFAFISTYLSRRNEAKTDLRAVNITRDPEAYVSMLEKVHQHPERSTGIKLPRIPSIISTHPPLEDRVAAVRRVFGDGTP